MIAEIYPVKRSPRSFGVFDYLVPPGMVLRRGSAVRIPFRQGNLLGYVARLKMETGVTKRLKPLTQKEPNQDIEETDVDWLEDVAHDLAQSVSSILYATIPTMPKRVTSPVRDGLPHRPLTLPASDVQTIQSWKKMLEAPTIFVPTPDLRRTAASLVALHRQRPSGALLIVAPNVRDAQLLFTFLGELKPTFLSGESPMTDRFAAWQAFRSRSDGVLVGTRLASLLPHPHLRTIALVRSGHPNYKQENRNPRYDARCIAKLRQQHQHLQVAFFDALPRTDEFHMIPAAERLPPFPVSPPHIISMRDEKPQAPFPFLSQTVVDAITTTLAQGKQALCIYNRKGMSHQLQCRDCRFVFTCQTCDGSLIVYEKKLRCHRCAAEQPLPLACPSCHGSNLSSRGYGNRAVAKALERLFPKKNIQIIEKGVDETTHGDILLVTRFFFEQVFNPFERSSIGLVAELDADASFFQPTFRATEQAVLSAFEWNGLASAAGTSMLLQTSRPDFFRSVFSNPDAFLENELVLRKTYDQPPIAHWMRVHSRRNGEMIHRLFETIRKDFPSVVIIPPGDLIVPSTNKQGLLHLFSTFPEHIIIDTHVENA